MQEANEYQLVASFMCLLQLYSLEYVFYIFFIDILLINDHYLVTLYVLLLENGSIPFFFLYE